MSSYLNQDPPRPESVRCPTCRAEQPRQPTCRRCKCDLALLNEVGVAYLQARHACLTHFCEGRYEQAFQAASRCHELVPGHESIRFMACMSLMAIDNSTAYSLGMSSSVQL